MWVEGITMAQTAYALDAAISNGDNGLIKELGALLSQQVKTEVSRHAEAEGWYEEYDHATSHESWNVETTVDPYGPAAFPTRVVPAEETHGRIAAEGHPMVSFDRNLIEKGLEQGVIIVVPEDEVSLCVHIGDNWFWAKMPDDLGPRADRHFPDISANEFTDAVLSTLSDLAEDPEDYGVELAYYDAYLREYVDLSDKGTTAAPELLTVSFDSKTFGEHITLALYSERYGYGDGMSVGLIDISEDGDDFGEEWGVLTVNLPNDPVAASWCAQGGHVVIDTNNNPQALVDALVREGVIELTGESVRSGFCSYPLATIAPKALSRLRGFEETADLLLSAHVETDRRDTAPGVSLKGEAEAMRESASQLDGGRAPSKVDPQR